MFIYFFFFHDTATTEIYTLSLHDALPICFTYGALAGALILAFLPHRRDGRGLVFGAPFAVLAAFGMMWHGDRKSTRLNSSHVSISYAVFCLKKKKNIVETKPTYKVHYFLV